MVHRETPVIKEGVEQLTAYIRKNVLLQAFFKYPTTGAGHDQSAINATQ
ncbi:hypothetical protein C4J98_3831 [Pseudomonas orientalis]|nr:hypothetical protein C4J98_3831 [Pseudomonas orientalis]